MPDPDTPAPPRFLPVYDNILLAHKDRSRMVGDPTTDWLVVNSPYDAIFNGGSVLVDRFVAAGWRLDRTGKRGAATLSVLPIRPLSAGDRAAVEVEARALLDFALPEASSADVRFEDPA